MTELEAAYNLGVADAMRILRFMAGQVPDGYALNSTALLEAADIIDDLKVGDRSLAASERNEANLNA